MREWKTFEASVWGGAGATVGWFLLDIKPSVPLVVLACAYAVAISVALRLLKRALPQQEKTP